MPVCVCVRVCVYVVQHPALCASNRRFRSEPPWKLSRYLGREVQKNIERHPTSRRIDIIPSRRAAASRDSATTPPPPDAKSGRAYPLAGQVGVSIRPRWDVGAADLAGQKMADGDKGRVNQERPKHDGPGRALIGASAFPSGAPAAPPAVLGEMRDKPPSRPTKGGPVSFRLTDARIAYTTLRCENMPCYRP